MKRGFLVALLLLIFTHVLSQSQDSIKAAADTTAKSFTWDVHYDPKGAILFLDVPYHRDNSDSTEYLTLAVAKDKSKDRPDFISVIVPDNVVQANGIFIKFSKTVSKDGKWQMELENAPPIRVLFDGCKDAACTARIMDGYAYREDGTRADIFQKFLDFDHVLFLFLYPDGSHKSVSVPLFSFKEQYKKS